MMPWQHRRDDDAGFTIIEMTIGLVVFAVFMTMFTAAIYTTFHSSNRTDAVVRTSQQIQQAFQTLDREVRYASYISAPGQDANDGNNWYVEMQDTNASPATCYQLRVDQVSQQLQQRTWTTGAPSGWQPLATEVVNGNAAAGASLQPFVFAPASTTVNAEQLTVNLTAAHDATGAGAEGASSTSSITFTALNTNKTTVQSGRCTGYRP